MLIVLHAVICCGGALEDILQDAHVYYVLPFERDIIFSYWAEPDTGSNPISEDCRLLAGLQWSQTKHYPLLYFTIYKRS